jgi:putative ABC transport system ATP-binding protein
MTAVSIAIDKVSRRFQLGGEEVWALRDVTLNIAPQEFLALIGRSGSGKTTLLNLIAGLDRPTSGQIRIDGKELTAFSDRQLTELRRRQIGFVFQSFGLLPLLSALENVELALRIAGAGRRERGGRSREVLEMMGLGRRMHHRPYELSGGEQQRVAIARAIANRPALILADEPTGELDSATAVSIFKLMRDVARIEGITIITSTHDRTVMELASRVEELADGRLQTGARRDLLSYVEERGGRRIVGATAGVDTVPQETIAAATRSGGTQAATVVAENAEAGETGTSIGATTPPDARWAPPARAQEPLPPKTPATSSAGDVMSTPAALSELPEDDFGRWAPPERRT